MEFKEDKKNELAQLFRVLANPSRLQILQIVARSKSCISGDISGELPLSRTTTIQHLKELDRAGFLTSHTEGTKRFYCLNIQKISLVNTLFQDFFDNLNSDNYCC